MWTAGHYFLVACYLGLPVGSVLLASALRRRAVNRAVVRLWVGGLVIGVTLCLVYARAVNGHARLTQLLLAWYCATGLLMGLECVNRLLRSGLRRLLAGRTPGTRWWRRGLADVLRIALLCGVGLPFVMAAVMVYRPKVATTLDAEVSADLAIQTVSFTSRDGTPLVGWWIPARDASSETVVLFHGLGAGKANMLPAALPLRRAGYNLFLFDFRAHGDSGGQLSSFGDAERFDAAAAIEWVGQNHPRQSEALFGLGASMGAAAAIAATTDDSLARGKLTALAVVGTYDSLPALADAVGSRDIPQPLGWLTRRLDLPLAGLHVGRDLAAFAPAELAPQLWPMPLLVVHGTADEIIPFAVGVRLYDAAVVPKEHAWVPLAGHNNVLEQDEVLRTLIRFFKTARPVPVI